MILIVISGDNNYRLTVADSLVPGNFPEHVAVEVGETIDADSADTNQQFVLAVLLSIGVITEEAFLGDDTLDESYAVALQALGAFAEDIKDTRSNPHPTLFERLTAYPDAITDDPDSEELAAYLPRRDAAFLRPKVQRLVQSLLSGKFYNVLVGGFPKRLFMAEQDGTALYAGDSMEVLKTFKGRLESLYSATVRGLIPTATAGNCLRNVFKVLRQAHNALQRADVSHFACGTNNEVPDFAACEEILELLLQAFAKCVQRFAVMYLTKTHREAFACPASDLDTFQNSMKQLFGALTKGFVPDIAVIEVR